MFPILGNRYHCLQCPDYDICEVCLIGCRRPGNCDNSHSLKSVPLEPGTIAKTTTDAKGKEFKHTEAEIL